MLYKSVKTGYHIDKNKLIYQAYFFLSIFSKPFKEKGPRKGSLFLCTKRAKK